MLKKLLFFLLLIFHLSLFAQEDCTSAITVCGNSAINYTPSGIGNVYENLGGCLSSGEHHSVWYKFTIATSGTLTFDLIPTGPVDYDWAIYGPNVTCSNKGVPIRCNASGNFGNTGMNMTNTNITAAGGNTPPYCKYMDVVAGQTYYLYIDNWSTTVYTFNLTWGGTATFVSPFNNPTTAPNPFIAPGNPGTNANSPREIYICGDTAAFNFSSLSAGILNGNSNFTVTYFNNANDAATDTNPITAPTTVNTSNIYYYNINYYDPNNPNSSINSCKQTGSLIFKNKSLSATINATTTILCPNGSITLTSNNATGNTWSTGATTPSITVTTPGTYTLTSTNGICTSPQASVTIIQDADPNAQITGNLTFCEGSSTTLTATATGTGNTFSWSNGVNGAANTVTTPGVYTVTVTTPLGCQYQKSVTVVMDPAIIVNIATPAQIDCTNSQITLNATASVYQPGATFLWTATGGGNMVSGVNTLTPTVNTGGIYTLIITSATPSGCVKQGSVTVVKNTTPPIISVTTSALTICKGQSVTLTASGAATYTWTGLSGTGNTQTVTPTSTTTYTVTGIGTNGCTATPATITINVVPEIVSPLHNIEICKGEKAILDAGTGPNYTYNWSTGATTQTISTTLAGIYSVTISNGFCSKTFTAVVSYIATPEILEIIYKNNTLTIIVKNNGNTPLEYSIDGGITWQSSNIFNNVLKNTQYSIRVRNKGALCDSSAEYYTFFMSNVITPNSDGKNDVIDFSEISKYGNFEGSIFDKYGKAVFKASSKNPVWDGRYLGRPLPTDTYWYKLFWEDRISKKPVQLSGWILLKNRD